MTPGENRARSEETAAVQREVIHGALVEQGGDGAWLGFDHSGCARYGEAFLGAGNLESKYEFCNAADIDMHWGADLGRHAFCFCTSGIISGR